MKVANKKEVGMDAIELLTHDHEKVKKLFRQFEKFSKAENIERKQEVATEICNALSVHAQAEEELFYPAAREAINDDDLINEADVEHATAKDLIAQIRETDPSDPMYDAKVTVLGEYIDHHIEEEQNEIFKKLKKAKIDLVTLGADIAVRKEMLMAELTEDLEEKDSPPAVDQEESQDQIDQSRIEPPPLSQRRTFNF